MQVLSAVDVSSPAYAQLVRLTGGDKEGNSRVAAFADDSQHPSAATQSWRQSWTQNRTAASSKQQRALKFVLTDASGSEFEALEDRPLDAKMPNAAVKPGLKLTLVGPMVARRGMLMLRPENVTVVGGCVEELEADRTEARVLKERLRLEDARDSASAPLHPTQTFAPKGVPTKYRQQQRAQQPNRRPLSSFANRRQPQSAATQEDFFNDSATDSLLASVDLPSASSAEQPFDDDADMLLSQVHIPSPNVQAGGKRRRF